jgi:hypothetical protein
VEASRHEGLSRRPRACLPELCHRPATPQGPACRLVERAPTRPSLRLTRHSNALNSALSDAVLDCRGVGEWGGGFHMLRIFILLSVVFVPSLLSLIYGVRYLIPALVVAGLASYELHSELSATKDADRSKT